MRTPLPIAIGAFLALVLFGANGEDARSAPTARVSFRRDVAPVLAGSCTTRSCHGGGSRPPVLGAPGDAAKLRAALVGVASEQRPDRAYIEPGHPDASYLLQKLDGHLVDSECADNDCGAPMPLDNPSLSADARAKIRAWIAQGAPNN